MDSRSDSSVVNRYLREHAPFFYLALDLQEVVMESNSYTDELLRRHMVQCH